MAKTATSTLDLEAVGFEHDAEWREADEKLTRVKLELREAETRRNEVLSQLAGLTRGPAVDRYTRQAMALLDGRDVATGAAPALQTEADTLAERARVLRHAVDLQRKRLAEIEARVSREIAATLAPEHRERVRAIVKAAVLLSRALEAEHQLRDSLTQRGITYTSHIRPMPFSNVGHLSDIYSNAFRLLAEAVEFNFITAAERQRLLDGGDLTD